MRERSKPAAKAHADMTKILLVEDNEMNRDMLTRRLEKRGYTLAIAIDGGAGVAMVKTEKPDLILMDMSLPVIDGWEATKQIKADPETKDIPIIALTAHAMGEEQQRCLDSGMVAVVTKPINAKALYETLARHVVK